MQKLKIQIPTRKKKLITSLIISSFLSLTLFFFGPGHIYFTNRLEFSYPYTGMLLYMILTPLFFILFFTFISLILKDSIYFIFISFLFVLSFLLWFQGNILVWDYGILDGDVINWNEKIILGIIDAGIWILLFVIFLIKPSSIYKIAPKISVSLILIMSISLLFVAIKAPDVPMNIKRYSISKKSKFQFSSKKNVIILILDGARADVFYELINKNDYLKKKFKDFVYYRNSIAGHNYTIASVPNILTGKYYDNSVPYNEYLIDSYTSNSIPKILMENGYRVDLFPMITKTIYKSKNILSNLEIKKIGRGNITDYLYLIDVTLFRSLPHLIKKYIYHNNKWFLRLYYKILLRKISENKKISYSVIGDSDTSFINKMSSKAITKFNIPIFKFYHLLGPHPPLILDENGKNIRQKNYAKAYRNKTHYKLKLAISFLEILKKLRIYDKSQLYILGDHGVGKDPENRIKIELLGYKYDKSNEVINFQHKAKSLALMMCKEFNTNRKKIKISDIPVSLSDIPEMIFRDLGINANLPGKPKKDSRRYMYFDLSKTKYLKPIYEYIISGFSWLDKSWQKPRRIFTKEGTWLLSRKITFGVNGNFKNFRPEGWGKNEKNVTRLGDGESSLEISIKKPISDILLTASISPSIITGELNKNYYIDIIVNGNKLGKWKETKTRLFDTVIPKKCIINDQLKITFKTNKTVFQRLSKLSKNKKKHECDIMELGLFRQKSR